VAYTVAETHYQAGKVILWTVENLYALHQKIYLMAYTVAETHYQAGKVPYFST
jgi:hypothetical protein